MFSRIMSRNVREACNLPHDHFLFQNIKELCANMSRSNYKIVIYFYVAAFAIAIVIQLL